MKLFAFSFERFYKKNLLNFPKCWLQDFILRIIKKKLSIPLNATLNIK